MYISLIIAFLLLLGIIIISMQNTLVLQLKFFTWQFEISLGALISYSSLFGGAIVAVIALPKLVMKYLHIRSLNKQIYELKKKAVEIENTSPKV